MLSTRQLLLLLWLIMKSITYLCMWMWSRLKLMTQWDSFFFLSLPPSLSSFFPSCLLFVSPPFLPLAFSIPPFFLSLSETASPYWYWSQWHRDAGTICALCRLGLGDEWNIFLGVSSQAFFLLGSGSHLLRSSLQITSPSTITFSLLPVEQCLYKNQTWMQA